MTACEDDDQVESDSKVFNYSIPGFQKAQYREGLYLKFRRVHNRSRKQIQHRASEGRILSPSNTLYCEKNRSIKQWSSHISGSIRKSSECTLGRCVSIEVTSNDLQMLHFCASHTLSVRAFPTQQGGAGIHNIVADAESLISAEAVFADPNKSWTR